MAVEAASEGWSQERETDVAIDICHCDGGPLEAHGRMTPPESGDTLRLTHGPVRTATFQYSILIPTKLSAYSIC